MDWSNILELLSGVFWEGFSIIFLAVASYVAAWGVAWIKENIKEHYAKMAVELAETMWDVLDGNDKFDKACAWLAAKMKGYKIKVSQEQIEDLIQTAWYEAIEQYSIKIVEE